MGKKGFSLKTLAVITAVGSALVSLASNWVADRKQEKLIEEKVAEALAKREQN